MNEELQDFTKAKDSPIYLTGFAWLIFFAGLFTAIEVDHRMRLATGNIRLGGIPSPIWRGLFVLLFVVFILLTALGSGKKHHASARALFCVLQLIPAALLYWAIVACYELSTGIDSF